MTGEMFPIHGLAKGKRLAWRNPQTHVSWAYMKMLREGNATRMVYPVNPYVEVYQFYRNVYGLLTQNCDGGPDLWMWLVTGTRSAMLINTGFGLGDTPALVTQITGGMPLIVVNTHASPDVVLGNCRFSKVYCSKRELAAIRNLSGPQGWDYLYPDGHRNRWLEFDRKDLPQYRPYDLEGVDDGFLFDLGDGYTVEMIWTGGCTSGHSMLLDQGGRYLFSGDDVNSDVISCVPSGSAAKEQGHVKHYRERIARLYERRTQFDYILPSRHMVNLENNVLAHVIQAADEVIASPGANEFTLSRNTRAGGQEPERLRCIRGLGMLAYDPELL